MSHWLEGAIPQEPPLVPDLMHGCNSWTVVDRATGKPVLETWQRSVAEKINQARYEVLTTHDWLVRFNRSIAK